MTAEHERLLALVAPLRAIGWVFLPRTHNEIVRELLSPTSPETRESRVHT